MRSINHQAARVDAQADRGAGVQAQQIEDDERDSQHHRGARGYPRQLYQTGIAQHHGPHSTRDDRVLRSGDIDRALGEAHHLGRLDRLRQHLAAAGVGLIHRRGREIGNMGVDRLVEQHQLNQRDHDDHA